MQNIAAPILFHTEWQVYFVGTICLIAAAALVLICADWIWRGDLS